jgi:hypothetical protein
MLIKDKNRVPKNLNSPNRKYFDYFRELIKSEKKYKMNHTSPIISLAFLSYFFYYLSGEKFTSFISF